MTRLKNKKNESDNIEAALLDRLEIFIDEHEYAYVQEIAKYLPEWNDQGFCEPARQNGVTSESAASSALMVALEKLKMQGKTKFYCGCGEVKGNRKLPNDHFIRRYKGRRLFDISFVSKNFYDAQVKPRYSEEILKHYEL